MKKVLIGVDGSRGSTAIFSVLGNLVRPPEEVILLHVERLEGDSLMIDMLGDAEMSTLKEALRGTDYKEQLDRKAEKILSYYKKALEDGGLVSIKTMVREGHPSEEILKVAEEEQADLIIMGCSGKKGLYSLLTGRVTRDVERSSRVPVLIAKTEEKKEEAENGAYAGKAETYAGGTAPVSRG